MDGYIHIQSGRIISVADEAARNWNCLFRLSGYAHVRGRSVNWRKSPCPLVTVMTAPDG